MMLSKDSVGREQFIDWIPIARCRKAEIAMLLSAGIIPFRVSFFARRAKKRNTKKKYRSPAHALDAGRVAYGCREAGAQAAQAAGWYGVTLAKAVRHREGCGRIRDSPLRRDDGNDNGMVCDDDRRGEACAHLVRPDTTIRTHMLRPYIDAMRWRVACGAYPGDASVGIGSSAGAASC